jgi:hypothetical protein
VRSLIFPSSAKGSRRHREGGRAQLPWPETREVGAGDVVMSFMRPQQEIEPTPLTHHNKH